MSRKIGGSICYNYNIDGALLKLLTNHPYLGVHFSNDLWWNVHVNKISSKANSTLAFLRRNLSMCSRESNSKAYKTLVRPQLECSCAAWDPHTSQNIKKLEDVQRRAARFVYNNYDVHHTSVRKLVKELGYESLEFHWKINRLVILHKAIKEEVPVPLPAELKRTTRNTRRNALAFVQLQTRTHCYRNSFFLRTIRE